MSTLVRSIFNLFVFAELVLGSAWQVDRLVGLDYPESALIRGIEGSVEIRCEIARDGTVLRAYSVSGEAEPLVSAAIRNAMKWKFRRVATDQGDYRLAYHFRIETGSTNEISAFLFVLPGDVFVTAKKKP